MGKGGGEKRQMTINTFDTEESNSNISSPQYYVDDDGSLKFISPVLSSSNFDGSVPVFEGQITADEITPGKFIKIGEEYFPVTSVAYDDPELEDDPSEEITVTYLDSNSEVQEITYNLTDDVDVKYENWEEKYLGTQGWSLTYGGNAIFANVGVRGTIEATDGFLENLDITGALTVGELGSVSIGSKITIDSLGVTATDTSGSTTFFLDSETGAVTIGGYATEEDLESASIVFQSFIDDLNESISASIDDIYIDLDNFSASVDFLYNAGFVSSAQLITTGATTITGNNITTGVIQANLIDVTTSLLPNRGVKLTALGLEGFDSFGNRTFFLNTNGSLTINGYVEDGDLNAYVAESELYNSGTTNISGGRIRTGSIESTGYSGGNIFGTVFSTAGMGFNLDWGSITAKNFKIDYLGNASFKGDITGSNGTFSGTVSGATINSSIFRTDTSGTRLVMNGTGDAALIDFYYFTQNRGGITALDSGLALFGSPRVTSWNNFRVVGSLSTTVAGSSITPSTFPNAQTPLQIRYSGGSGDNFIGVQTSTLNIKENIVPLIGDNLTIVPPDKNGGGPENLSFDPDNIYNITPVEYTVIEDESKEKQVGFIVEDLANHWPQAVTYDYNTKKPFSYNTGPIVAGLVYAVKKQKKLIEDLENRVLQLESQLGG